MIRMVLGLHSAILILHCALQGEIKNMNNYKISALCFVFGFLLAWIFASAGVNTRDEALIDYFIANQEQLANAALNKGDLDLALFHQKNSVDAASTRGEYLGLKVFSWGVGSMLSLPMVKFFGSEDVFEASKRNAALEKHARRRLKHISDKIASEKNKTGDGPKEAK